MRRTPLLIGWLIATVFFVRAEIPKPPVLVLTSLENGTEPQDAFSCSGKIHGYLVLPTTAIGKHVLEGIWTKPDGTVASHSRSSLDFPAPGRSTAYVWFAFPERSLLPGVMDPAQDQERLSYSGQWRVDVRWDDQTLRQSTFTVHCH